MGRSEPRANKPGPLVTLASEGGLAFVYAHSGVYAGTVYVTVIDPVSKAETCVAMSGAVFTAIASASPILLQTALASYWAERGSGDAGA